MRRVQCFLFAFIFLVGFSSVAQSRLIGGKKEGVEPDRQEAEKLVRKAKKLWKEEQFIEAEKLYYQSNALAASLHTMMELALAKMELGDIKGANKVWDDCIASLSGQGPFYSSGKIVSEELYKAYYYKIDQNINRGSSTEALKTTIAALTNLRNDHGNMFGFWKSPSFNNHVFFVSELAFHLEDRKSLSVMENLLKNYEKAEGPLFYVDVYGKMLDGKFDEAITRTLDVEDNGGGFNASKSIARFMLPLMYAYKGDYLKSEEWMKKSKRNILIGDKMFYAIDGRNALSRKDYLEAVKNFTLAIQPRKFLFYSIDQPGKFSNYTKRAAAYEGLGDFINAKKDYQAALIYEPDYEPALTALARLEGRVISERRSDKLPPEIIITEPASLMRGLKVTGTGTDMMIKGIAKDSFGLKSVSINGTPVYNKEDGNFWGNVSLKPGLNTVTIEAVDMAGNKAAKTIEIEQPAAPVAVKEDDIVVVNEKEGKNYALFIASQNYDDASISSLENPIADAVKLKLILKKNYGFKEDNIISLYNPEKSNFRQQFQQLSEALQPEDNLVIFYAGHGVWVEKEKKGYWLLTDAKRNDSETWVANKDVLEMIAKLPTRHTLLITDACFSGGVFKTRSLGKDAPAAMVSMNEKISRVAITSGNDTEVPDESVFMKYLVKALSENKDKYLTAQKMFITQIIEAVMTETKTEPRYGTLELAGHVGGDFIFVKK